MRVITALLLWFASTWAQAADIQGRVVGIADGDTLTVPNANDFLFISTRQAPD